MWPKMTEPSEVEGHFSEEMTPLKAKFYLFTTVIGILIYSERFPCG